ncbi:MAG: hypothetical protein Kow0077_02920 [Anaerolineae bacterium]
MTAYSQQFEDALNDCIDRLHAGEPLQSCLARYPELAEELRPLLESGLTVRRGYASPSSVASARERVRGRLTVALQSTHQPRPRRYRFSSTLALAASLVLVLAIVFSGALRNLVPAQPQPTPTATLTPTPPVVTDTASPPATPTSTTTPTETVTVTAALTETVTPTATATATPTPTPSQGLIAGQSPTACQPQRPQGWIIYRVQPGDTLSGLAANGNTTVARLVQVNCLEAANLIVVGQQLFVPPGTSSGQVSAVTPTPSTPPSGGTDGGSGGTTPGGADNTNDNDNDDDNDNADDDNDNEYEDNLNENENSNSS